MGDGIRPSSMTARLFWLYTSISDSRQRLFRVSYNDYMLNWTNLDI
jgi:hypothetical protein